MSNGQGVCSSPYFGEDRTEENFLRELNTRCEVHLPTVEQKTLVMKLNIDIKETLRGSEMIMIFCSNQTLFSFQTHVFKGKEMLEYKLRISDYHENLRFTVILRRSGITDDILKEWNPSKVTGFSFEWYFKEPENGSRVEIPMSPKYLKENKLFIKFINWVAALEKEITAGDLKYLVWKAKILWNTLEAFVGYGDGLYEMSAMKAKATTSSFLALSETERGCQTEKTNLECRQENFQELAKSCNCTPFSLADSTTQPLVSGHL